MGKLGVKLLFVFVLVQMCSANGGPDCGSATVVGALPYHDQAILDVMGGPSCAGEPSNDVFYSFTAPADGYYVFSLGGSTHSNAYRMRLWTDGTCCAGASILVNFGAVDGNPSHTLAMTSGQAVIIELGLAGQESILPRQYKISIYPLQTDADICPGVTVNELPFEYFTFGPPAGNEINACDALVTGPDAFFRVLLSETKRLRVSTCLTGSEDTIIELVQSNDGTCFNSFHIACGDNECGSEASLAYTFLANTVYYIALDYRNASPSFTYLRVEEDRELCPGQEIPQIPFFVTASTSNSSDDFSTCNYGGNRDHVYRYTPASSRTLRVSLCGSSYDTALGVFRNLDGSCNNLVGVACNDNSCGTSSELTYAFEAGYTYFIVVDGAGGASGYYSLSVEMIGDLPETAIPVSFDGNTSIPTVLSGSTTGYSNDTEGCGVGIGPDVFYHVTITGGNIFDVTVGSINNPAYHPYVEAYVQVGATLQRLNFAYDDTCGSSRIRYLSGVANFFLVVDDSSGQAGDFRVELGNSSSCPGTAIRVTSPVNFAFSTTAACRPVPFGPSGCVNSQNVRRYNLPAGTFSGYCRITLCSSTDHYFTVTRSHSLCGDQLVACSPDSLDPHSIVIDRSLLSSGIVSVYSNSSTEIFNLKIDAYQSSSAIDVPSLPFSVPSLSASGAAVWTCNAGIGGESYFRYAPESTQVVRATQSTPSGPVLGLLDGLPFGCNTPATLACGAAIDNLTQALVVKLLGGAEYFFVADQSSFGSNIGAFTLSPCAASDLVADSLTVRSSGNDVVLNWTEANCAPLQYNIHRTTQPDVSPSPANLIATTLATSYTDTNVVALPSDRHFYVITTSLID